MSRIRLLASLVGLTLGVAVNAQAPTRPAGFPPVQVEAHFKDGHIISQVVVTQYQPVKKLEKRTDADGTKRDVEVTEIVPVLRKVEQKIDATKAIVYRAGGKDIDAKELAKVLAQPTMVFVAGDYRRLDPFYLQFLADDALVIVPPQPEPEKQS